MMDENVSKEHYMQKEAEKHISGYHKATGERDQGHCRPSFPGRL